MPPRLCNVALIGLLAKSDMQGVQSGLYKINESFKIVS